MGKFKGKAIRVVSAIVVNLLSAVDSKIYVILAVVDLFSKKRYLWVIAAHFSFENGLQSCKFFCVELVVKIKRLNGIRIVVRVKRGIVDFSGGRGWLVLSRLLFLFEFHEIVGLGLHLGIYWFLWCFIFLTALLFLDDLPIQWSWREILYYASFYLRIEAAAKALEEIYHPLLQITL